jgi:hypothetical protein
VPTLAPKSPTPNARSHHNQMPRPPLTALRSCAPALRRGVGSLAKKRGHVGSHVPSRRPAPRSRATLWLCSRCPTPRSRTTLRQQGDVLLLMTPLTCGTLTARHPAPRVPCVQQAASCSPLLCGTSTARRPCSMPTIVIG